MNSRVNFELRVSFFSHLSHFSQSFRRISVVTFLVHLGLIRPVYAKENFWEKFYENPSRTIAEIPPKINSKGHPQKSQAPFKKSEIFSKKYISIKDKRRQILCPDSPPGGACKNRFNMYNSAMTDAPVVDLFAGMDTQNMVIDFFPRGKLLITSIRDMDSRALKTGAVTSQPWSGDYWPIYRGSVGSRYGSSRVPYAREYPAHRDFFKTYWPIDYSNQETLDGLSPAEKYDLLLQDSNFTLTNFAWNEADEYFKQFGKVETWMGLCHGWAPAAYRVPRPTKTVELEVSMPQTLQKIKLNLFPDDIKALATLSWARSRFQNYFLGGRCNDKAPKTDENGRIISPECFDANPGSWHISLVNQLGLGKQSFVMDATYDYEVWNQPVVSYEYRYVNLNTRQEYDTFDAAILPKAGLTRDPFTKYRDPKTKYIVGVSMKLGYISENGATHGTIDAPRFDSITYVRYYYDLELDENYIIIGGEWYQNAHPDMLWTPTENARAWAIGDNWIQTDWNGLGLAPQDWQQAAQKSSAYGQPLSKFLDILIKLSQ